jgi:hypothetical protein
MKTFNELSHDEALDIRGGEPSFKSDLFYDIANVAGAAFGAVTGFIEKVIEKVIDLANSNYSDDFEHSALAGW